MKSPEKFLKEHRMHSGDVDLQSFVDDFTSEMLKGLQGNKSSLRMIPTFIEADNQFLTDTPVVAIDAGGTNFRAALVKFNSRGELEISETVNSLMPGLEGEISKAEFFKTIAGYIKPVAEKADRIGFCFSYPTEILPDKDGILLQFCKEVQAPEVVGQLIGKNLLETLGMQEKKIVLLNDTVATLLAGKSSSFGRNYDSYIGYILGTGTNTCYIENNKNIHKRPDLDANKSMIINIESGNYGKVIQTDIDIAFDKTTVNPGDYRFEKMISGGYFGGLCLTTLQTAAREKVFSPETSSRILSANALSSEDVNNFITNKTSDRGPLQTCIMSRTDDEACIEIIDRLIDRAAKLVAGNLSAVILKTDKGKSPDQPILLTVEGSIYYKLHNLRSYIHNHISDYLNNDRKRYIEFMEVKQSSLVGAALAALID